MPRTISVILAGDASPLAAAYAKAGAATEKWARTTTAAHAEAGKASTKSVAEIKAAFNSEAATMERANQRMIAALHAQEAELLRAQQAAQRYGKATAFLDKHSASLNRVATGLAGVGVAAGAAFAIAVKSAADFDQAMSKVQAAQGGSTANMVQLRQAAIKWGQQTKYSATEAADGITQLIKAGVSARDVLNGGLQGALNLAASGEMSVADAAEDMASALNQFGLHGRDATHVADLMAAAAGKAQGNVSDMATALKYVGPVAAGMGVSIEETSGAIAELASNGILGDQAGTSLRGMLLSLTSPSMKAAKEMQRLGINVYDAAGNFIGFSGIADQLHEKLGKLSNSERDAALGVIFGNHQVTAARVLYNGGADAVDKWTRSVNDSGFAARQAQTNMNNLKGDVEQLRGALETALIGAGEGQQGVLRQAVQGLTDLVNAWSDLPDEVKSAVGRIVGVLGILSLGGAGTIKVLQGVAAMRKAMVDMGGASGPIKAWRQLASGVDEAGVAITNAGRAARIAQIGIPLVGFALAGVTTAIGYFQDQQAKEKALAEEFSQAMDTITGSVNDQTVALNKNVQQVAIKNLSDAGAYEAGKKLGLSYNDITQAAIGNTAAQKKVKAAVDDAFNSQAKLTAGVSDSVVQFNDQEKTANKVSKAVFGTSRALSSQIAKVREQKAASAAAAKAQRNTANSVEALSKKYSVEAINANQAAIASRQLGRDHKKLEADTGALKDATQKLINEFTILRGGELDVQEASDQFKGSLHDLITAEKANGKSLDDNTVKGRANRQSIRDVISAMNDNIGAQFRSEMQNKKLGDAEQRAKKATDDAAKSLRQQKQDLINAAEKAGYNRGEVKKMVDQMVLTPSELRTEIKAFGIDKLEREIKHLQDEIDKLKGKHDVRIDYSVLANGKQIKGLATVIGGGPKVATARAGGGPVYGPGTATSDSILTRLSNGEFVIKEASVRKIGIDRLMFMNATGQLPAFRDGGLVNHGINHGGNGAHGDAVVPQINVTGTIPAGAATAVGKMITAATNAIGQSAVTEIRQALGGGVRLGSNRIVTWHGGRFTENFANHLKLVYAQQPFTIYQGGFRPTTSYSGSTHNKDAVDVGTAYDKLALLLRQQGIAAWHRYPYQGPWVQHTHGVPGPNVGLASPSAAAQYRDYLNGGNGLGGKDDGPHVMLLNLPGVGSVGGGGSARAIARAYMTARYGAAAWPLIDYIGMHESGWNVHARNPQSGAYGVGQALPGSKMAAYGPDWRNNERTQLAWMAGYMDARYGGPRGAYNFWRTHHWYAGGGPVIGAGTGTSDSINARLSNGEYVVNAAATARNRALLDYINFGARGYMRMATGGPVGDSISKRDLIQAVAALIDSRPSISGNNIGYNPEDIVRSLNASRRSKLHQAGIGLRR